VLTTNPNLAVPNLAVPNLAVPNLAVPNLPCYLESAKAETKTILRQDKSPLTDHRRERMIRWVGGWVGRKENGRIGRTGRTGREVRREG
jgi:hypothetical protein